MAKRNESYGYCIGQRPVEASRRLIRLECNDRASRAALKALS
jgi:hypothetical protein